MSAEPYLLCSTTRKGHRCPFMEPDGCTFPGGCRPVPWQCIGCSRIIDYDGASYCQSTPNASLKWLRGGTCNLATHIRKRIEGDDKHLNPLKASKRSRR